MKPWPRYKNFAGIELLSGLLPSVTEGLGLADSSPAEIKAACGDKPGWFGNHDKYEACTAAYSKSQIDLQKAKIDAEAKAAADKAKIPMMIALAAGGVLVVGGLIFMVIKLSGPAAAPAA